MNAKKKAEKMPFEFEAVPRGVYAIFLYRSDLFKERSES
jgi:hypothetical protein